MGISGSEVINDGLRVPLLLDPLTKPVPAGGGAPWILLVEAMAGIGFAPQRQARAS